MAWLNLLLEFLLPLLFLLNQVLGLRSFQNVRIDVMTSISSVNVTIPGVVATLVSAAVPDEGIVGSVVGSRSVGAVDGGCWAGSMPPANNTAMYNTLFVDSFVALMQRNLKCNFADGVRQAEMQGFSAILVYDHAYIDTTAMPAVDPSLRNTSIPTVYISFLDGRLLWKKFQHFSGAYVVITAAGSGGRGSGYNSSATSGGFGSNGSGGITSTQSSDVANVLLGFIPAVSYVCIVLSVILIIIARRFIHCSLFVVYKMAMHHNPKVAPLVPTSPRTGSKVDVNNPSGTRCTICLDEFKPTDLIHAILPCQHVFHQVCIDLWLRKGKLVCPLCRRKITLKKIIRHVLLSHDASQKGHVFVIPSVCRPSAGSDSAVNVRTVYPT
ncbi:hypothetical protein BV898_12895 [Hypsibius exemplaris]|uniref:RING-type domain-containing protein n=1 Tax=Hypsibius exemplaris TaxID=2072580 RepID=A0A1W0WCD6_HYPEX|nr:hypothetical protein BV898_12895 [Hypsibius exemplaris]